GKSEVRFAQFREIGHPFYASSNPPAATLVVKFPDAPLVRLRLDARTPVAANSSSGFSMVDMLTPSSYSGRHQQLQLAAVEIGPAPFAVASRLNGGAVVMDPVEDASPVTGPTVAPAVSVGSEKSPAAASVPALAATSTAVKATPEAVAASA